MIVNGNDIPESLLLQGNNGKKKCLGEWQGVKNKKKIQLDSTGDKKTNALLAFLKCQVKATKTATTNEVNGSSNSASCQAQDKEYTLCHQSFMGVGSYKGKKHCGDQMAALYKCIVSPEGGIGNKTS